MLVWTSLARDQSPEAESERPHGQACERSRFTAPLFSALWNVLEKIGGWSDGLSVKGGKLESSVQTRGAAFMNKRKSDF